MGSAPTQPVPPVGIPGQPNPPGPLKPLPNPVPPGTPAVDGEDSDVDTSIEMSTRQLAKYFTKWFEPISEVDE